MSLCCRFRLPLHASCVWVVSLSPLNQPVKVLSGPRVKRKSPCSAGGVFAHLPLNVESSGLKVPCTVEGCPPGYPSFMPSTIFSLFSKRKDSVIVKVHLPDTPPPTPAKFVSQVPTKGLAMS